jgi:hypothetical protein
VDVARLKQALSPVLLEIEGVCGVGLPGGQLTVYLVSDDPEVKGKVREVVARTAPTVTPRFEVTGAFQKH